MLLNVVGEPPAFHEESSPAAVEAIVLVVPSDMVASMSNLNMGSEPSRPCPFIRPGTRMAHTRARAHTAGGGGTGHASPPQ